MELGWYVQLHEKGSYFFGLLSRIWLQLKYSVRLCSPKGSPLQMPSKGLRVPVPLRRTMVRMARFK